MPIYDIMCQSCGKNSEVLAISSNDPLTCPGSPLLKRIAPALVPAAAKRDDHRSGRSL
jgi:putative FmdB family regulatory protein